MSNTKPTRSPPAAPDIDLPEGWAMASLGHLVFPSKEKVDPRDRPKSPYLSLEHIESGSGRILGQGLATDVVSTKAIFRAGDVLYGKLRPYLNKVCIPSFDGICSTDILVFSKSELFDSRYLLSFLMLPSVVEFANHNMSGVQLPRISFEKLATLEFPVAPLAEQKRIGAKVEALFKSVSAVRARLGRVPAILKRFRKSVLTVACSGQLTSEWREREDNVYSSGATELPNSWHRSLLRDVCEGFEYGSSQKSDDKGEVAVLRMGNLQDGEIDWSDLKYSSDRTEIAKYNLSPNTVLFNRTNSPELVGKTAIYRGERPAIFAGYLIKILHGARLNPEFLNYCLNTPAFREYCAQVKSDGVSQSNINAQKLAQYELALPPMNEQREIVRRIKSLFALADRLEAHVRAATVRAERLPQAILGRAFRGELVPTEAELAAEHGREYETASVLVERVLDSRKPKNPAEIGRGGKNMAKRSGRQRIKTRRPLDEVLREQGKPLTPERLFDLAGFDKESLDGFYEELRKLIREGKVRENRPNRKGVTLQTVGS